MAKVSVVYRAPEGDSKVCEMFGYTFFDGQPVEIEDSPDNAHAIKKLSNHALFELSEMGVKGKAGPQPAPRPAPPTPTPAPEPDDDDDDEAAEDEEPPFKDYKPAKNMPARKKGARTRKTAARR